MSQDQHLANVFKQEQDVFIQIASRTLEKPADKVTPEDRTRFKQIVYGIIYGMGKSLNSIGKAKS